MREYIGKGKIRAQRRIAHSFPNLAREGPEHLKVFFILRIFTLLSGLKFPHRSSDIGSLGSTGFRILAPRLDPIHCQLEALGFGFHYPQVRKAMMS